MYILASDDLGVSFYLAVASVLERLGKVPTAAGQKGTSRWTADCAKLRENRWCTVLAYQEVTAGALTAAIFKIEALGKVPLAIHKVNGP